MRVVGYSLMVATALTWSSNGITSRLAFDAGLAPRDLAAIRIFGAALLFGGGFVMVFRRLTWRQLALIAAFGCVGITLAQYLYYEAIDRIDVAVALVIVYMNPIMVAGWQRVVHGERLPLRAKLAMALAIGGVVVMVVGRHGGLGAMSTVGLGLALATAVAASAQTILAARLPSSLTAVQRTGGAMIAASVIWMIANPAWTIPWGSLDDTAGLGPRLSGTVPLWVIVVWVTVIGTALPYLMLVAGILHIGPGAASVTTMLEPVVAAILAWVILDQSLAPLQIVGIATALAGVLLVELARIAHLPEPQLAVGD